MTIYILRPNGEAKADATEVPAQANYLCLDDNYTQPDTPDTSDYTYVSNYGNYLGEGCNITTATLDGPVTLAIIWAYISMTASTGSPPQSMLSFFDSGHNAQGNGKEFIGTMSAQWIYATNFDCAVPLSYFTQANVDGLEIQVDQGFGTGVESCYCMYLELRTGSSVFLPRRPERGLYLGRK